jgi:hypothetical protein
MRKKIHITQIKLINYGKEVCEICGKPAVKDGYCRKHYYEIQKMEGW